MADPVSQTTSSPASMTPESAPGLAGVRVAETER